MVPPLARRVLVELELVVVLRRKLRLGGNELEPPADPDGLPRAMGEPEYVARSQGTWHVHNGGWSPDSKSLVYTRDTDHGDIYELVKRK